MKTQSLPFSTVEPPLRRLPRSGIVGLLLAAALVLWYGTGTTVFAPNLFMLAFWFVLTHLLLPMVAFSVGWLSHTIISRTSPHSFPRLFCSHLCLLFLACVSLPLLLAAINHLPVGQSTTSWRGRITSYD